MELLAVLRVVEWYLFGCGSRIRFHWVAARSFEIRNKDPERVCYRKGGSALTLAIKG
jgi:hypothetical protein